MPKNPCNMLPDSPGMYVGYSIERDDIWISLHDSVSTSTLHMPIKRALDLADAIYDHATGRSFQRMYEAGDE